VRDDLPPNPWFSTDYLVRSWPDVSQALSQHVSLTVQAVLVAAAISFPLAFLAHRWPRWAPPVLSTTAVLYTVPSLALFALLAPWTGIGRTTVLIGLVVYALMLLTRGILTGLRATDPEVADAARGMGYSPTALLLRVELPQALPAVFSALRLTTVSTVALVTVGVVVGYGGLGQLLFRGLRANYRAEVMTATLLALAVALVADLLLAVVGRLVTPWARRGVGAWTS